MSISPQFDSFCQSVQFGQPTAYGKIATGDYIEDFAKSGRGKKSIEYRFNLTWRFRGSNSFSTGPFSGNDAVGTGISQQVVIAPSFAGVPDGITWKTPPILRPTTDPTQNGGPTSIPPNGTLLLVYSRDVINNYGAYNGLPGQSAFSLRFDGGFDNEQGVERPIPAGTVLKVEFVKIDLSSAIVFYDNLITGQQLPPSGFSAIGAQPADIRNAGFGGGYWQFGNPFSGSPSYFIRVTIDARNGFHMTTFDNANAPYVPNLFLPYSGTNPMPAN